jgi:hypothetical protein
MQLNHNPFLTTLAIPHEGGLALTHRSISLRNTTSNTTQHSRSSRTEPEGLCRVLFNFGRSEDEDSSFRGGFYPCLGSVLASSFAGREGRDLRKGHGLMWSRLIAWLMWKSGRLWECTWVRKVMQHLPCDDGKPTLSSVAGASGHLIRYRNSSTGVEATPQGVMLHPSTNPLPLTHGIKPW